MEFPHVAYLKLHVWLMFWYATLDHVSHLIVEASKSHRPAPLTLPMMEFISNGGIPAHALWSYDWHDVSNRSTLMINACPLLNLCVSDHCHSGIRLQTYLLVHTWYLKRSHTRRSYDWHGVSNCSTLMINASDIASRVGLRQDQTYLSGYGPTWHTLR